MCKKYRTAICHQIFCKFYFLHFFSRYVDECLYAYRDPAKVELYKIRSAEDASKLSLAITTTIYQGEIKNFIAKKFKWTQLKMSASVQENISHYISKKMSKKPVVVS